jgi:hypothetical protein
MTKGRSILLVVVAMGCHHTPSMVIGDGGPGGDAPVDGTHSGPCWPMDATTPGGSVELGTGFDTFEPMPDQIALEYGPQGGFDIPARSRMTGMAPGDPSNVLDPKNPRTRIRSFFVDTGAPNTNGTCGGRFGYVADTTPSGSYDMPYYVQVEWDTSLLAADLFGKQFLVVLEVIDGNGLYAIDQKTVTALPPPNWFQDAGVH